MTGEKWAAGADPGPMLSHVWRASGHRRKFRLVACAFCRRARSVLRAKETNHLLELVEQHADGLVDRPEVDRARERWLGRLDAAVMGPWRGALASASHLGARWRLSEMAREVSGQVARAAHRPETELRRHCDLIRDVFGDPFRPVAVAPSWRTLAAVGLAEAMYAARDFANMPILADALEDAGCDKADVLAHCRGDGPHVRGCWVVDLVLGKS